MRPQARSPFPGLGVPPHGGERWVHCSTFCNPHWGRRNARAHRGLPYRAEVVALAIASMRLRGLTHLSKMLAVSLSPSFSFSPLREMQVMTQVMRVCVEKVNRNSGPFGWGTCTTTAAAPPTLLNLVHTKPRRTGRCAQPVLAMKAESLRT